MDRLAERIGVAARALDALDAVLCIQPQNDIARDAAIQRFEFSLEATWKAAQLALRVRTGDDVSSPKGVVRACRGADFINDATATQLLLAIDDRNLTVHTYNERTAGAVAERLQAHAHALRTLLASLG